MSPVYLITLKENNMGEIKYSQSSEWRG